MAVRFCTCSARSSERVEGVEFCSECGERIPTLIEKVAIQTAADIAAVKRRLDSEAKAPASNGRGPDLALPPEWIEGIAQRAAAIVIESIGPQAPEDWLNVEEAAKYLAAEPHRIYDLTSRRVLRCKKDGRRLLFRRAWLDAVLEEREP